MNYDIVLKNINYLDIKEHKFKKADIGIKGKTISRISKDLHGKKNIICTDKYLVPGFIDSHSHLESSIINPVEFTKWFRYMEQQQE
jgi:adenine deaminase